MVRTSTGTQPRLRASAYLFPWDVVDDATADAVADLSADSVTLAAVYHSVRALAPRHPDRRIVTSDRTRAYTAPPPGGWASIALPPADEVDVTGTSDTFGRARDLLAERDLPVRAWLTLTHVDGLTGRPDLLRRTVLGDALDYALCPAQPEVLERSAALVTGVLAGSGTRSIVLEAVGPLSAVHVSEHDKTGLDGHAPELTTVLSFCFCPACCRSLRSHDIDDAELMARVRSRLLTGDEQGAAALLTAPGVRRHTAAVAERALAGATTAAVRAGAREVLVHATALPTDGGPAIPVGDQPAAAALTTTEGARLQLVASCWLPGDVSRRRVAALAAVSGRAGASTGAFVNVLRRADPPSADLPVRPAAPATPEAAQWRGLLEAGATELHLYHAGLASTATLRRVRTALADLRQTTRPTPEVTR
ncbi:hypothetical protein [Promicromonospora iranensis]|uniref:Alanine-rich protein n=1 Tax=Promicromonospora iranensis TaxID=1105144 RepID=A0ABU2CLV9_9MICO|nr:hypothetical protein [Promicromonospora iranensis]MDR7382328.1 hypothetical protein [Promicromonospora iranensis]